ncbi:MAG: hypothetical protein KAG37_04025 [Flavobacteriales bacterium]|nr:hypothetical protein [Flavobacteriales bacterium]
MAGISDIYHKDNQAVAGDSSFEHSSRNAILDDYSARAKAHVASLNNVKKKEAYDPDNPFAEYM